MLLNGYHYTSWRNWKHIRRDGLIPSPVYKDEILYYFPQGINAIWLWENPLTKEAHAGSIIFQAGDKKDWKVVLLEVKYDIKYQLKTSSGIPLLVTHNGDLGKLIYHRKVPAILVTSAIGLNEIKLLAVYDIIKLMEAK